MDAAPLMRSRGFAFVAFATKASADAAVEKLAGCEVDGRAISVREARPLDAPVAPKAPGQEGDAPAKRRRRKPKAKVPAVEGEEPVVKEKV